MKLFNTIFTFIIISNQLNFFSQEKPNVVMIVLDDLNDFVGVMKGHPQTQTPNIDKLASQSVLFSNAHSNVPVCSPSRASFMTGVHPLSSGIWGFGNALKEETFINTKSIPEYMKENGYKVFQSGKVFHSNPKNIWDDNGVPADYGPVAYNGNKAIGHPSNPAEMAKELGPLDATFVPLSDVPNIDSSESGSGYHGWRFSNWQTNRHFNYVSESERDLLTDEMSAEWFEKKIDWIRQNQKNNEPFFIATGFIRPHTPLVVPKKYYDKFPLNEIRITEKLKNDLMDTKFINNLKETRGQKAWRLLSQGYGSEDKGLKIFTQAYLASVNFADEMVGRVLDAIDNSIYANNTIVILFSDHGYLLGQKDHLWKYNLWEETTRVPLIIRQPNNDNNAGKTVNHPVSLIDIFPTIADYCSLTGNTLKNDKGKNQNGFSLRPFVENPNLETWSGPKEALTVVASWKSNLPEKQNLAIRTDRYRYIKYFDGSEELYDHEKDINEWVNLAKDKNYMEIVNEMRIRLENITESYIEKKF